MTTLRKENSCNFYQRQRSNLSSIRKALKIEKKKSKAKSKTENEQKIHTVHRKEKGR